MKLYIFVIVALSSITLSSKDLLSSDIEKGINYKFRPHTFNLEEFAEDLAEICNINFDFIRLLIEPPVFQDTLRISHISAFIGQYKEIDSVLNVYDLKTFICLHKYISPVDTLRNTDREFWISNYLDSSKNDFKSVVLNTCKYETVIGYSWIEEPQIRYKKRFVQSVEDIHEIQQELILWVNENAKDKKFLVSTAKGAHVNGYKDMTVYNGQNIIYNFYMFSPRQVVRGKAHYPGSYSGTYWDKYMLAKHLDIVGDFAAENEVEIFCGSYGCNNYNECCTEYLQDLEDLFETRKISHSYHVYNGSSMWSLKKKKK